MLDTQDAYGSARWLTAEDLNARGYGAQNDSRPLLGDVGMWPTHEVTRGYHYLGKRWVRDIADGHIATIARTGAGKGRRVIWPNCRKYAGSMLICDPKGEAAIKTAVLRQRDLGQDVFVVDPFGLVPKTSLPRTGSASFNPIQMIRTSSYPFDIAMMIAESLIIPAQHDPHWGQAAQRLLAAYMLFVALDNEFDTTPEARNFVTVWGCATNPKYNLAALRKMSESPIEFVASQAGKLLIAENMKDDKGKMETVLVRRTSREIFSVEMAMTTQCDAIMNSPEILSSLKKSSFDFGALRDGKTSIYLVLPFTRIESHGAWMRMLLACACEQIYARGVEPHRADGTRRPPILAEIDELLAYGRMQRLLRMAREGRGSNIKLHLYIQDVAGLKDIYGEGWKSFLGNCAVLQYFGGTNEWDTCEYLSKLTGQSTIIVRNTNRGTSVGESVGDSFTNSTGSSWGQSWSESSGKSWGTNGSKNQGWSFSESFTRAGRALIMPDEVARLDAEKQLLIFAGVGSILGSLPDDLSDFESLTDEELRRRERADWRIYPCRTPSCAAKLRVRSDAVFKVKRVLVKCPRCTGLADTYFEEFLSWADGKPISAVDRYKLLKQAVVKDRPTARYLNGTVINPPMPEVMTPAWDMAWRRFLDPHGVAARYPILFGGEPRPIVHQEPPPPPKAKWKFW